MEPKTFAELGLSPTVQAAITAAGYTTPTPIQAAAIPVAVSGRDVLGIAQTGTGKTAAFVMPMITRLETGRARARMPRSLILAPTRELAAQVAQSFEKYGINHKLTLALLIGGVSMDDQVKKLDRGVDVLIATPGRLLDHFQRGRVMLMGVEILVIDEADRMLDMGFIPDIEKICKLLPPRRQTLFFSATMPPEITRLVHQFLKDPERIEVAPPATTAKTITQRFVFCPDGEDWAKREVLRKLIGEHNVKNAIIFCNRKVDVAILHRSLVKHGFSAGALHGDMDQKNRTETLDKFRAGDLMLLAASDVAARGLDIPDVSHIFNYDLPWQPDDYVHRIGRTGRAGKEGCSTSLVTTDELKSLRDIEKMLGEEVVWIGEPPTADDYAQGGKKRRRGGRAAPRGRSASPAGRSESKSRPGERRPAANANAGGEPGSEAKAPRGRERGNDQRRSAQRRPDAQPRTRADNGANGHDAPVSASKAPAQAAASQASASQGPAGRASASQARTSQAPASRTHAGEAQGGQPKPAKPRPDRGERSERGGGDRQASSVQRTGFADNVPAFMRNSVKRPVKVASE